MEKFDILKNLLTFAPCSLTTLPYARSISVPLRPPHPGSRRFYFLTPPSRRNPSWSLHYSYSRPARNLVFIYKPISSDYRHYPRHAFKSLSRSYPIDDSFSGSVVPLGFPLFAEAMSDYV